MHCSALWKKELWTLIGATTENPSFEVNAALLSRCQVYILKSLDEKQLVGLLQHAIDTDEDLSKKKITLKETAAMINISGGDARKLLNPAGTGNRRHGAIKQ